MKIIRCDICEEEFDGQQDMIAAHIPSSFFGAEGEGIEVDVCSLGCLSRIGTKQDAEVAAPAKKPEPIGITPEMSERMTGVKMKY